MRGVINYYSPDDDLLYVNTGSGGYDTSCSMWKCRTPPRDGETVEINLSRITDGDVTSVWRVIDLPNTGACEQRYCDVCDAKTPHTKPVAYRTGQMTQITLSDDGNKVIATDSGKRTAQGYCVVCQRRGRE